MRIASILLLLEKLKQKRRSIQCWSRNRTARKLMTNEAGLTPGFGNEILSVQVASTTNPSVRLNRNPTPSKPARTLRRANSAGSLRNGVRAPCPAEQGSRAGSCFVASSTTTRRPQRRRKTPAAKEQRLLTSNSVRTTSANTSGCRRHGTSRLAFPLREREGEREERKMGSGEIRKHVFFYLTLENLSRK